MRPRPFSLFRRASGAALLLAGCLAALPLLSAASIGQDIVHVEEDWQLVLGQPDPNTVGPQVATTMSPLGDITSTFFTFEINHRSAPYWTPGGLTIHQWSGDWRVQSFDRTDRTVMDTANETLSWTQILDAQNGTLTFQVKNGSSTTWGPFGYSNLFKLSTAWGANNINGYTPDVSVSQSGVAFAGNRVQSLKITTIRVKLSDGTSYTDNTQRTVHLLVE